MAMYLGPFRFRRTVTDPLTRLGDDGLTGMHVERAGFVLDTEQPSQDDGDLLELRTLARLLPATWRDHPRHADRAVIGIHSPGKLLDPLGFVTSRLNDRRTLDQSGHDTVFFFFNVAGLQLARSCSLRLKAGRPLPPTSYLLTRMIPS